MIRGDRVASKLFCRAFPNKCGSDAKLFQNAFAVLSDFNGLQSAQTQFSPAQNF
jgi:hypothetical protein